MIGHGRTIGIEHQLHLVMRLQKGREDIAPARDLLDVVIVAGTGDPDHGMRLLVRARPYVHHAAMGEAAFEIERPIVAGPGFHDQIDAFPEALQRLRRVGVGGEYFIGHPTNDADVQASS